MVESAQATSVAKLENENSGLNWMQAPANTEKNVLVLKLIYAKDL